MANQFLYIDDMPVQGASIVRHLNSDELGIKITVHEPQSWDEVIDYIRNNSAGFDGILIDWKLGKKVGSDAETLAQNIRADVSQKKGLKKDLPVMLCSTEQQFRERFRNDDTSHDLFLAIYTKDELANQAPRVATEMNALAEAFKTVQAAGAQANAASLLVPPQGCAIDWRIEEQIGNLVEKSIPHNIIRFILRQVVGKPEPLIDEHILAARLGIDTEKSEDWPKLCDDWLTGFQYTGILSGGWKRWWAAGFMDWWKKEVHPSSPQSRQAKQRVKELVQKTRLEGLVAAKPQKHCSGSEFWTACVINHRPLDPIDGFPIIGEERGEWQDRQYVSPAALLDRFEDFKVSGFRIDPYSRNRWQSLRNSL